MELFRRELAADFPRTPDHFRECVNRAVAGQIQKAGVIITDGTADWRKADAWREGKDVSRTAGMGHTLHRGRIPVAKLVLPVAACLVLLCGTVAAAGIPAFQRWLESLGVNERAAEELVIHGEEQGAIQAVEKQPQETGMDGVIWNDETGRKIFTVTDAYFDGATLMFWASPSETPGVLDFGDHVYINGTDNRLEYVVETEEGSGIYECKVTIMDESLMSGEQDALDITVGVFVEGAGKKEASFRIASDKLRAAGTVGDQRLELPYGAVEVCDLYVAPSSVKFHLKWEVYSGDARELIYYDNFYVEDSSGNRCPMSEIMNAFGVSPEVYDEAKGCWNFVQEYDFKKLDSAFEYIVLIPYEAGCDAEGDRTPGTEVLREDMSFKIMLK